MNFLKAQTPPARMGAVQTLSAGSHPIVVQGDRYAYGEVPNVDLANEPSAVPALVDYINGDPQMPVVAGTGAYTANLGLSS